MTWKISQGLAIGYKGRPVATVIEEIVFEAGQVSLLLGLNGEGKTTLMKTLAGLLPPVAGNLAKTRVLYLSDDVDISPLERLFGDSIQKGNWGRSGKRCYPGWKSTTKDMAFFRGEPAESTCHICGNYLESAKGQFPGAR
jgi:ATPase subunit of ABC transporter with duplicated ATPase domains